MSVWWWCGTATGSWLQSNITAAKLIRTVGSVAEGCCYTSAETIWRKTQFCQGCKAVLTKMVILQVSTILWFVDPLQFTLQGDFLSFYIVWMYQCYLMTLYELQQLCTAEWHATVVVFSDLKMSRNKEVVAYFKVQFCILHGGTEEKNRKP